MGLGAVYFSCVIMHTQYNKGGFDQVGLMGVIVGAPVWIISFPLSLMLFYKTLKLEFTSSIILCCLLSLTLTIVTPILLKEIQ